MDSRSPDSRNALAKSRSPYLLQHAGNPVEWREWGSEAFEWARERDVPIFLSIGYSTCHWCHVMAHESFENEAIAARMNAGFVNIKVDREERPDVDRIYMAFVQSMTGRGGWPMSPVFAAYGVAALWPRLRIIVLGLMIHMALDGVDCIWIAYE